MFFKDKKNKQIDKKSENIKTESETIIKENGIVTRVVEKENIDSNNTMTTYTDDNNDSSYKKVASKTTYINNEIDINPKNSEERITKILKIVTILYIFIIIFSLVWILNSLVFEKSSEINENNESSKHSTQTSKNNDEKQVKKENNKNEDKQNENKQTEDEQSGNKSLYTVLGTLFFGSATKSLYKMLILMPYNFNEERLKKNETLNFFKTFIDIFVDIIGGTVILMYIYSYFKIKTSFDSFSLIFIPVSLLILFVITAKFTGDIDSQK